MEMHQLRYFQMIARTKNYRQAAEKLHVSQPALTKAIHKLEEELGVPLFDRIGRSIEVSVYGKQFLSYVDDSLRLLDDGVQKLQYLQNPMNGMIRLAFLQTIGTTILPNLLRAFRKHYPNVQFDLQQCNSKRALDLLSNGDVDLCLVTNFSKSFGESNWLQIQKEKLYGYCSVNHRLNGIESIAMSQLKDEPFIGYKDYLLMEHQLVKWCNRAGFTPKLVFQGTEVPTIAGLISANLGIGILPYYSGLESLPVHRFEISDTDCSREVGLAWRNSAALTAGAKLLVDFTRNEYIHS